MSIHPCFIIPPYMLDELAGSSDDAVAQLAERTRGHDESLRAERTRVAMGLAPGASPAAKGSTRPARDDGNHPLRSIHDCHQTMTLPGDEVRAEGAAVVADATVNQAYDGLGDTWAFYREVFGRDSVDGAGLPLVGSVHYGKDYDNAFWNGEQMCFGDGDGEIFVDFTSSVDVIGHELTHGVTQYTAALTYEGQSGALNESLSDVFGSMVKQHALGQTAESADWLIGASLLAPGIKGRALRDMLHPGTAYDDPRLGKDPQPADMAHHVETSDDNGGVHLNSGIPNRAFALAATALGGHSWEKAGQVWYDVLTGKKIQARCDFATFAQLTIDAAAARFGAGSAEQDAIAKAWQAVGVLTAGQASDGTLPPPSGTTGAGSTGTGSKGTGAQGRHRHPTTPAEDPSTPVTVQRTGGIAGVNQQRSTTLGALPESDAEHWSTLLAGGELHGLAAEPAHPDGFSYRVVSEPVDLDVTLREHQLPVELRDLFVRTLQGE